MNKKYKTYIVSCANYAGGYSVDIYCSKDYEDALECYRKEKRYGGFIMLCVTKKEYTDSEWSMQDPRSFVYDRELSDWIADSINDKYEARKKALEFETSCPKNKHIEPEKTEVIEELKDND